MGEKMKPLVNIPRFITFLLFALSCFSQANETLRYNYQYSCNKERIVVGRCRHDSDMPGVAPTKPENDYCQVSYPDRPKQGGFTVETVELRGDVLKKLTACGAFGQQEAVGQVSDSNANDANAEFKVGKAYFDKNDYANAAEHFKRSTTIDRSAFLSYLYLGITDYDLKQYVAAIDALKVTVDMVPAMPEGHYWLGVSYTGLTQYTSAESELREAIRLNADFQQAYTWLGITLSQQKKYPDAIESFEHALRQKPDDGSALYSMGLTYARMGQKENAMQAYRNVATIDPKLAENLLAEINGATDGLQTANKGNSPTAVSKPVAGGTDALVAKAKAFFDAKDYPKAIEACNRAIALDAKNPDAHFYLAMSYDQSEQWDSALKAWNNYIPMVQPWPSEFILLGDANRNLGHYDEALKAYQKALELKPDAKVSSGVYYWIGVTYNHMKRYDQAVTALLDSIRLNSNYHHARKELGQSYMFLGRNDDGIASFKEAIRLKPNDAEAHYLLGIAYAVAGMKAEAMQEYKKLQTLDKTWGDKLLKGINQP